IRASTTIPGIGCRAIWRIGSPSRHDPIVIAPKAGIRDPRSLGPGLLPGRREHAPMKVLMLYPKFPEHTFWNVDGAMKAIAGKTGTMPPLGLLTIASYLPEDFEVRLIDRNVEEETDADW